MVRWLEEQRNPVDSKGRPILYCHDSLQVNHQMLLRLAAELPEWAKATDKVNSLSLLTDFKIFEETFYDWRQKSTELNEAYKEVKRIMGEKRERLALEGKYNATIVLATMPLYNQEYRDWKREQFAAKEKAIAGTGTIQVSMIQMPTTDIVPTKEEPLNDDD